MVRNIGAVLAGFFVGSLANMAIIMINFSMFSGPEGLDMNDPEQMKVYLATLPVAAFLVAIVAHLAQAGLGGWLAARLGATRPVLLAMIVGGLTMVGGIVNMINIDGPAWMWVEMPLYLLVAWGAGTLEASRRDAAGSAES